MKDYEIISYELGKRNANLDLEEIADININVILTGKAGADALNHYYKDIVKVIDYFDPLYGNDDVNPVTSSGYRLSSYIYHVYTNDTIYKLVPINKYNEDEM